MRPDPTPINPALASARSADLGGALKRQMLVVVACVIVGAALGLAYSTTTDVTYESRSTVLLQPLPGEKAPGGGRERTIDVETQKTVARSTALLQRIGARLGLTAVEVKNTSRVEAAPTGDVLYIYYEDAEDVVAAQGALVYTEEYLALRAATANDRALRERTLLDGQIAELRDDIGTLTADIQAKRIAEDINTSTELEVLQQQLQLAIENAAALRDERDRIDTELSGGQVVVDPRTSVNRVGLDENVTIAGGAFVGLLVGIVVGLLRDRRDDRYGSALGLESIGVREIGTVRLPAAQRSARSDAVRRSYARLVVRLGLTNGTGAQAERRSVLIAAVESVSMPPNIAHAVTVALVDEAPDNGIDARIVQSEAGPTVAEGDTMPSWDHLASVLEGVGRQADVVFVTATSLDRSASALAIAPRVDQVVLLVSPATKLRDLQSAVDDLRSVDAHDVWVLAVRRPHGIVR